MEIIVISIIVFFVGALAGFYFCTQVSDKHAIRWNEMRTKPVRIMVSYIEQGSGKFYRV